MKKLFSALFTLGLCLPAQAVWVEVPKVAPGNTAQAGAGKQWPTTRFVADASGGCITDNLTGLMWAKDASLLGTASWGSSATAGTAQYKLDQMNTNSNATGYQLCSYSDWRLPNINELGSLFTYAAKQNASISASWLNSQGFINVQFSEYWSSTAYDGSNAWFVNFRGSIYPGSSSSTFYVWPVRGGK